MSAKKEKQKKKKKKVTKAITKQPAGKRKSKKKKPVFFDLATRVHDEIDLRAAMRLQTDDKGWVKFLDHPHDPDLSYWAKRLPKCNADARIAGAVRGVLYHYWVQFRVEERHADDEHHHRPINPRLCKGSHKSYRCAEAQFQFWRNGPKVLVSRVCAFIWGNIGFRAYGWYTPIQTDFVEFAEFSLTHKAHEVTERALAPAEFCCWPC